MATRGDDLAGDEGGETVALSGKESDGEAIGGWAKVRKALYCWGNEGGH